MQNLLESLENNLFEKYRFTFVPNTTGKINTVKKITQTKEYFVRPGSMEQPRPTEVITFDTYNF